MKKQTAANNEFLKGVKTLYNAPTFKKMSLLVNAGKQDLAEYALETGLTWYVGGVEVAEKLMSMGYKPAKNDSIETLFDIARNEN